MKSSRPLGYMYDALRRSSTFCVYSRNPYIVLVGIINYFVKCVID